MRKGDKVTIDFATVNGENYYWEIEEVADISWMHSSAEIYKRNDVKKATQDALSFCEEYGLKGTLRFG